MTTNPREAKLLLNPIDLAPIGLDYNLVRCDINKSIWWATDRKGNAGYGRSVFLKALRERTTMLPTNDENKPTNDTAMMPYRVEASRLWNVTPDDIMLMGSGKTDYLQNQAWLFATWQRQHANTEHDFYKNPWVEIVWLREYLPDCIKGSHHVAGA